VRVWKDSREDHDLEPCWRDVRDAVPGVRHVGDDGGGQLMAEVVAIISTIFAAACAVFFAVGSYRSARPQRVVVTTVRGESYRGQVRPRPALRSLALIDVEALNSHGGAAKIAGTLEIRRRSVELVQRLEQAPSPSNVAALPPVRRAGR
jgi:hypothetical protein